MFALESNALRVVIELAKTPHIPVEPRELSKRLDMRLPLLRPALTYLWDNGLINKADGGKWVFEAKKLTLADVLVRAGSTLRGLEVCPLHEDVQQWYPAWICCQLQSMQRALLDYYRQTRIVDVARLEIAQAGQRGRREDYA